MKKIVSVALMLCLLLGSMAIAEPVADAPRYTYRRATDTFPINWSPHESQTYVDSAMIGDYVTRFFFDFDYNETMDGYVLKPELVVDYPIDVTADYVSEEWGIAEGETARAWRFTLRDDIKWQDGTPIVAGDFVASAKLLLSPDAQCHRADTLYSGNMVIKNSEAYLKQGKVAETILGAYMDSTGFEDVQAFLAEYGDLAGCIDWDYSFCNTYDFEAGEWTGDAEGGVVDTGLTLAELYTFYTEGEGGAYITWMNDEEKKEWALFELYAKYAYAETSFDQVGVKSLSDTELVLILAKPLEGFYLYDSLTINWLVHEALYNQCASMDDGVYHNTYGTSAETTMSFGPYMLTSFQSDQLIVLEKNPYWYGYNEAAPKGQYQTTIVQWDCVAEPATRLEMFLNGQLDQFDVNKDYIAGYGTSDFAYRFPGNSIFAMAFNPNFEALTANQAAAGEHINKTILTIKEFRMAMSLALNRAGFCLAAAPMNGPAYALYGPQIVGDLDNGIFYRNTDVAKQVVVDFWGLTDEVGEGKPYATIDDAIDSISGYNVEMGKAYFDAAYDEAIAKGFMCEDDVVEIIIGLPSATNPFYNSGIEFLMNNYAEAVKGTKLEGKLTFKRDDTIGNRFGDALAQTWSTCFLALAGPVPIRTT